jgi:hypothetical protein
VVNKLDNLAKATYLAHEGKAKFPQHKALYDFLAKNLITQEHRSVSTPPQTPQRSGSSSSLTSPTATPEMKRSPAGFLRTSPGLSSSSDSPKGSMRTALAKKMHDESKTVSQLPFPERAQQSINALSQLLYLAENNALPNDLKELKKNIEEGRLDELFQPLIQDRLQTEFKKTYLAHEEKIIKEMFIKLSSEAKPMKISRSRLSPQSSATLSPEEEEIKKILKGRELTVSFIFMPPHGNQGDTMQKVHHVTAKSVMGVTVREAQTLNTVKLGAGAAKTAKRLGDTEALATVTKRGVGLTKASKVAIKELQGKEGLMTGNVVTWKDKDGNLRQGIVLPQAEFFLHKMPENIPPKQVIKFFLEVAKGVKSMHDEGWVHQDIKPANIMIVGGKAYLTDFDTANNENETKDVLGTEIYFSPQKLIKFKQKNTTDTVSNDEMASEDIFNLGASFYDIFNPKTEFAAFLDIPSAKIPPGASTEDKLKVATQYLSTFSYSNYGFGEPASDTLEHLVWEMVNPDSSQRPSIDAVIARLEKLL